MDHVQWLALGALAGQGIQQYMAAGIHPTPARFQRRTTLTAKDVRAGFSLKLDSRCRNKHRCVIQDPILGSDFFPVPEMKSDPNCLGSG